MAAKKNKFVMTNLHTIKEFYDDETYSVGTCSECNLIQKGSVAFPWGANVNHLTNNILLIKAEF